MRVRQLNLVTQGEPRSRDLIRGKSASLQLIAYRRCFDKQDLPIRFTITVHVYVAPNLNEH